MKRCFVAILVAITVPQLALADQHDQAAIDNWAQHRWDRPPVAQEYKDSVLVFVGTVLSARKVVQDGMTNGTFYSVRIVEGFKGKESGLAMLYSENSSGGFEMKIGAKYLVFAYLGRFDGAEGLTLAVNCAGNSRELGETAVKFDDLRALKKHA